MNIDRVQALLVASALCTTPFLFGAQGKGCQSLPIPDAGVDASPPPRESDGSACIDNILCIRGDHFDPVACKCVPDEDASPPPDADTPQEAGSDGHVCIDNVLCIRGDHFDPVACKCVPDEDASSPPDAETPAESGSDGRACVDNVLCILGDHWDPVACKCVPGCATAADCHGALPQVCVAQCDGGPGACAHFVCRAGACQTVICD